MIDRNALGEPNNVVLDEQSDLNSFSVWTKAGTENGMQFWAQLNHLGKQSPGLLSKEPVAPSAIAFQGDLGKAFNKPRALTDQEILVLIQQFAIAANLAKKAGFTGVQIHGGARLFSRSIPFTSSQPAHRPMGRKHGKPYALCFGNISSNTRSSR